MTNDPHRRDWHWNHKYAVTGGAIDGPPAPHPAETEETQL